MQIAIKFLTAMKSLKKRLFVSKSTQDLSTLKLTKEKIEKIVSHDNAVYLSSTIIILLLEIKLKEKLTNQDVDFVDETYELLEGRK